MSLLNLDNNRGLGGRKYPLKYVLGFGLVIAAVGIGTTLASTTSISINNNQTVEFGQGATQTVFCGGTEHKVTITPVARFLPGTGEVADKWVLDTLEVSNIADDCIGKDFILQNFNKEAVATPWATSVNWTGAEGSGEPVDANIVAVHYVDVPGLSLSRSARDYRRPNPLEISVDADAINTDTGRFTIYFDTANTVLSSSIGKITIETQDDTFGAAHPEA
jgi:hypothetical protein